MNRWDSQNRSYKAPVTRKAILTDSDKVVGSNRDWKLLVIFCVVAIALIVQLANLQVFAASGLREEAKEQRMSEIVIHAKRGTIYDRNGNVLAMSVDATTIYANPQQVIDPRATADILADILGGTSDDYYKILSEDTTFVYIKQQADVSQAQALIDKELEFKEQQLQKAENDADIKASETPLLGVYYLKDTKRVYPYGSIGAQVIGGVNIDNRGAYGLELMYDNVLRGTDGKLFTEYSLQVDHRPLSGQPIPGSDREEIAPVRGSDIIISIDIELQQYVENELVRVGEERASESGNALVLDGASGEIYATASLPLLDRDNLTSEEIDKGVLTLKSICTSYEPGSIFKPVTAAAILDEQAMSLDEELLVADYRDYEDYTIKDAVWHDTAMMSLNDIITQSSNVGISMVKDRISDEDYYTYLKRYGFGKPTHVDFPAEGMGIVDPYENWSDIQAGNISFGQGLSVTSLEIASFYGAIINDGAKYQPHFLIDRPQSIDGSAIQYNCDQIMRPETANTLEDMLVSVVANGTGYSARIDGYTVAGKTGTAQKAAPGGGGYLPDEYIVSFVGFYTDTNSKLVCITSMDNPIGADGQSPTGPLFASIMRFVANKYMIEPINITEAIDHNAENGADKPDEDNGTEGEDPNVGTAEQTGVIAEATPSQDLPSDGGSQGQGESVSAAGG